MSKVKKIICCLVLLSFVCVFTGCNTVHGAGKDVEKAGQGIQNASQ